MKCSQKIKSFFKCTALLVILMALTGCGIVKTVPVETIIQYETRDSLVLRDSTVLIPKERIVDVVPVYDSLEMETSMAKAKAWVDTTTHTLKGTLENKQGTQYKYIYKDKIVYRDSIVTKEVPVEVEKIVQSHYRYEKWLWIYLIASLLAIGAYLYIKFK